jgi:AAA+ ATPase superfamily predicted ATPase
MQFIDRENELEFLNKKWNEEKFQLIVLYGKRRVGKTSLMRKFVEEKPGVYFLADKRELKIQLAELLEIVGNELNNPILQKYPATDWLDFFNILKNQVKERFVLVIDEYPYLTEVDSATSSIFQKVVDKILEDSKIFLVLSGSSIAMMENEVLNYTSPLYGRRTGDIWLKPLTFKSSQEFYPNLDFHKFLEFYMVLGGLPAYISRFDPTRSTIENITDKILTPGELFNEVNFILRQEFREPTNYFAILKAISVGKRKYSEIVNSVTLASNQLTTYLQTLENLHLITKEYSVTDEPAKSKKGLYKLQDNFYKFWFQYIYPFKSYLEFGEKQSSLSKISEDWQTNLGKTYEDVCRELIWSITAHYPDKFFVLEKSGRWWDNKIEIDLVGFNKLEKKILFGECKYSNKVVGMNIYLELKEKAQKVDWYKDERQDYFVLFSGSGFTPELIDTAKKVENLILVHQDKVLE